MDAKIIIGLDRASVKNRIDPQTRLALSHAYYDYEHDPSLRAAVVLGMVTTSAKISTSPRSLRLSMLGAIDW